MPCDRKHDHLFNKGEQGRLSKGICGQACRYFNIIITWKFPYSTRIPFLPMYLLCVFKNIIYFVCGGVNCACRHTCRGQWTMLSSSENAIHPFWDRVSHWVGAHQLGQWVKQSSGLSGPALGWEVCIDTPGIFMWSSCLWDFRAKPAP